MATTIDQKAGRTVVTHGERVVCFAGHNDAAAYQIAVLLEEIEQLRKQRDEREEVARQLFAEKRGWRHMTQFHGGHRWCDCVICEKFRGDSYQDAQEVKKRP